MKKWLLVCALGVGLAANVQGEARAQKIEYRRDVPSAVKRLMPKGAKSLFWGNVARTGDGPMAIHLFSRIAKEISPRATYEDGVYHFMLDVFELKRKSWHRINRVPVTYKSIMFGPVLISMNLTWLNNTATTAPVLMFDGFTNEALMPGPYGDGVFVVFKDGWKGAAHTQSFGSGTSNYSSLSYRPEYDDKGVLRVVTSETTNDASTEEQTFNWNGREFVFTPGTETRHNPSDDFKQ